jgi:hypothetical protein
MIYLYLRKSRVYDDNNNNNNYSKEQSTLFAYMLKHGKNRALKKNAKTKQIT